MRAGATSTGSVSSSPMLPSPVPSCPSPLRPQHHSVPLVTCSLPIARSATEMLSSTAPLVVASPSPSFTNASEPQHAATPSLRHAHETSDPAPPRRDTPRMSPRRTGRIGRPRRRLAPHPTCCPPRGLPCPSRCPRPPRTRGSTRRLAARRSAAPTDRTRPRTSSIQSARADRHQPALFRPRGLPLPPTPPSVSPLTEVLDVLVLSPVFKTGVGGEELPGQVRFLCTSAKI